MANLSVEEPDALMCARPGLWEPWAGNCPGLPGLFREFSATGSAVSAENHFPQLQIIVRVEH